MCLHPHKPLPGPERRRPCQSGPKRPQQHLRLIGVCPGYRVCIELYRGLYRLYINKRQESGDWVLARAQVDPPPCNSGIV